MKSGILRDYDIRALAEEELTSDVVCQIGRAFGTHLIAQGSRRVVLGRDNRLSSERIAKVLSESILSTGCDVIDIGETATPLLCFSIAHLQVDGGAMVTGSHNPPEFNGIKLQVGDRPLYGECLKNLARIIDSGRFARGSGSLAATNVIPDYFRKVKERIHVARRLRLVIDCGNGSTCIIAPPLLKELGCEVIPLYCESDGTFPHHHPDPAVATNLKDLTEEVKRTRADIGIAYDGDGNRIGVVDDKGCIVSPDILLGLLARDIISQRGPIKVVCDVKTSQAVVDDVENHGGTVVMCKAGYPFVLEKMFAVGAALAGELPGHICFNEELFAFGDAVYVSCRLIQLLSQTPHTLSELLSDFPSYFSTPEIRIPCPDDRKFQLVQELQRYFGERYRTLNIDGIRVLFDNQSWALVRASNTEPALSLRFEARSRSDLESARSIVASQLRTLGVVDTEVC